MLFQSEGGHGYNAGFYFARPKAGSIEVLKHWIADLEYGAGSDTFEEQHSLGRSLQRRDRVVPLQLGKLNISQFPNGKIWYQLKQPARKDTVFAIHCNWVKKNKKGRLLRDNLWALDALDEGCDPSWNPYEKGCTRFCRPVKFCGIGKPCLLQRCAVMLAQGWHRMALDERKCNDY